jgi:4-amino-4-deoxy-L-arabinose transferase-like glycosyltransferase
VLRPARARPFRSKVTPAVTREALSLAWKFRWHAAIGAILAIAAFLRFFDLSNVPLPLTDEVYAAVDLHTLVSTGRHFDGSSADTLAYIVATIDGRFISLIWGHNLLSIRVISATFGLMTVALMVPLGRELGDFVLGVIAAAVLAVMPWGIYFSRIFYPASEVAFLTCLALLLALTALRRNSLGAGVGSAVAAVAAVYIYPVSIVAIPLLLASVIAVRFRQAIAFGPFKTFLVAVLAVSLLIPYAVAHFAITDASVANQNVVIANQMLWNHGLSATTLVDQFFMRWFSFLSAPFTILRGDPNIRWSIQVMGSVGWIGGILGWIGLAIALGRRQWTDGLLLLWLGLYPVGDALTSFDAAPNSVRGIIGAMIWALLAATTIRALGRVSRKRFRVIACAGVCLTMAGQVLSFSAVYFGRYDSEYAYAFETGYPQIYQILSRNGLQSVPITLHAGYNRYVMLQFFSDYHLHSSEQVLACYDLPPNVLEYTVLPRVFIVREDNDVQSTPGCIHQGLIQRDEAALLSVGALPGSKVRKLDVVAVFKDDVSGRYSTAILYLHN